MDTTSTVTAAGKTAAQEAAVQLGSTLLRHEES